MSSSANSPPGYSPAISSLLAELDSDEIVLPQSAEYIASSLPWAAQKDLKPSVVIRPKSVTSLSKVISHLYETDLDFVVRGQGFNSASAKDVMISMGNFDDFEFDRDRRQATVGAGQKWGRVYEKMEEVAPDFARENGQHPKMYSTSHH